MPAKYLTKWLNILTFLFLVVVVLPTILSWGKGLDLEIAGLRVGLHRAAPALGLFFLSVGLIFLCWPDFRRRSLAAIEEYDHLTPQLTKRIEAAGVVAIGLWLAFLKWEQSRLALTNVYDHGIFVNVLWNLAHGNGYWNSFKRMNFLGDHFSPFLWVLSIPFRFGDYPAFPLLAQTAAMMVGLWLILQIATQIRPMRPFERLLILILFSVNRYFQSVHQFDIHPIAFAIPVVLFMYLLAQQQRWRWLFVLLPFALFLIQEDVPIMIAGLGLLLIAQRKYRPGAVLIVAGFAALWLNVAVFQRAFNGQGNLYVSARYTSLGASFPEIIKNVFLKPWIPLKIMFSGSRLVSLYRLFSTFGFLPVLSLVSIAGFALPALQHVLSDHSGQFEFGFHYASNVLPFLMIGTVTVLSKRAFSYKSLVPFLLLLAGYSSFLAPRYIRYRDPNWLSAAGQFSKSIPENDAVAIQGDLGSYFGCRKEAYLYPDVGGAQWIVLAARESAWPMSNAELEREITRLRTDRRWQIVADGDLLVFHRRKGRKRLQKQQAAHVERPRDLRREVFFVNEMRNVAHNP